MKIINKLIKKKMKMSQLALSSLFILTLTSGVANAQSGCNISSSPLSFGAYNPFSLSDVYSSSSITVSCPADVPAVVIKMNPNFITGDLIVRHMKNMSQNGSGKQYELAYSLFTNYDRTVIWGNGLSSTDNLLIKLSDTRTGTVNFYGTLYKGQNVYTGVYADSTTIELEY